MGWGEEVRGRGGGGSGRGERDGWGREWEGEWGRGRESVETPFSAIVSYY